MDAPNIVIVESPAKAKKIEGYLGPGYKVLASYGHVRDLVNKDGSVLPDENFAMKWELGERAAKTVNEIKRAVEKADAVYLAPDPDREGEAIAWHVKKILEDAGLLKGRNVYRVTFNEITKTAVKEAFDHARTLDHALIDSYLARRALDYLVGFNLSPILWRKLPGSRSAGRVQSVALRLISEREAEIEKFNAQEYWSIETLLHNKDGAPFTARLTHLSGNKLDKMDIGTEEEALKAEKRIREKKLSIQSVEKKQVRRNPPAPFITSSLQIEAARKLGFSASNTMRIAQRLYEAGLITYMRTDGTDLSQEAVQQARGQIKSDYGDKYLPEAPRLYKSKAKNAQEAHEAIRPTDLSLLPGGKDAPSEEDQRKLYDLIWKRTMASQMENAVLDQVRVDISDGTDDVVLRANGSVISFDGFLTLYHEEQSEDEEDADQEKFLPELAQGEPSKLMEVRPAQHFTQPPPRYTEASLVKKMEELGIGRPSTYASILQVLRDRSYVTMDRKRFVPEDRGRIVTTFLARFFTRYVDYDFTANLEEELDAIASGKVGWQETLRQFWIDFSKAVDETKELRITEVIDHLDAELAPHFFHNGEKDRICPACTEAGRKEGRLSLKLGKFGAFIGCTNYPDCRFTKPLVVPGKDGNENEGAELANNPKILGEDPDTGRAVSLRRGPYGPYVQIDAPEETAEEKAAYQEKLDAYEERYAKRVEAAEKKGKEAPKKPKAPKKPAKKPKRQGLPAGVAIEDVTLEKALELLSLPREIGPHPETGKMITAGIGRFGPFVNHDGKFASIPKDEDVMSIGMNRAVDLIAKKQERDAAKAAKSAEKSAAPKPKKKTPAKKKKAARKKPAPKKTAKK
ncbi:MAG: type I DNA topoisomerase [Rhodospirillales bacterium]|nr:type I DNA topoisomerase [Alphaproteobacteria bacterium]USO03743.1 MAG: type I DNA topoisomerase [Rhodospirillales bacterium]